MNTNRKLPTEASILDTLKRGRLSLPPLSFELAQTDPLFADKYRLDALVDGRWYQSSVTFAAEIKARSTPKDFAAGIALLKTAGLPKNRPPLLIVPFLSESQLQELDRQGINGVDLCGNGVINIPQRLTVFRTGQPNTFPSYLPIKNIYRNSSSIVGRVLFSSPKFSSVNQVVEAIARRDIFAPTMGLPSLTLGTVSKVLSALEQDLIIQRDANGIALLQPDTLLEKLSRNYATPPAVAHQLKVNLSGKDLLQRLAAASAKIKAPVVATGLSSVGRYAVMQREEKLAVYCPRTDLLLEQLAPASSAATRFPNLEIFDTQDPTVYFDATRESEFLWASPVQTYLELMAGDKRDQDTASQVRALLLNAIETNRP
jgi:hypothetical protein